MNTRAPMMRTTPAVARPVQRDTDDEALYARILVLVRLASSFFFCPPRRALRLALPMTNNCAALDRRYDRVPTRKYTCIPYSSSYSPVKSRSQGRQDHIKLIALPLALALPPWPLMTPFSGFHLPALPFSGFFQIGSELSLLVSQRRCRD